MKFSEKDRPHFQQMTGKQKFLWFWTYYRWFVIIGVIVLLVVIFSIRRAAERKEDALNFLAVNADTNDYDESIWDPFLIANDFDPEKSQVLVNRNIAYYGGTSALDVYSLPSLQTIIGAGGADCIICERDCFTTLASLGAFHPVSEIFTPEELEKLEGQIEYVEMDPDADPYISETEEAVNGTYARGIRLESGSILDSTEWYPPDTELILALPFSADHAVLGQAFMKWILL